MTGEKREVTINTEALDESYEVIHQGESIFKNPFAPASEKHNRFNLDHSSLSTVRFEEPPTGRVSGTLPSTSNFNTHISLSEKRPLPCYSSSKKTSRCREISNFTCSLFDPENHRMQSVIPEEKEKEKQRVVKRKKTPNFMASTTCSQFKSSVIKKEDI